MNWKKGLVMASVGWYLMVPNYVHHTPDENTVLVPANYATMWQNVQSFDSAKECEDARDYNIKAHQEKVRTYIEMHSLLFRKELGYVDKYQQAECLSSDDFRLVK